MKFIIFDIDGTLTNTKNVEDRCFKKAFQEVFRINIDNQNWAELANVTDWGITEEIVNREENRFPEQKEYDLFISLFTELLREEMKKDQSQFSEIPGAATFFHLLLNKPEYRLGIATGSWEKSALIKLHAIGIDQAKVTFSNSDYFKSREEIVSDVIDRMKDSNDTKELTSIVYFGDGVWDYKTCKNLNISFIGVDFEEDKKLARLGATRVIKDYENYEDILNLINNI